MKERRTAWNLHIEGTEAVYASEEVPLGPQASYSLMHDPKHMVFVLSRYKFCAKMLAGRARVLEVGCGDAFGVPIVAHEVGHLRCIDWEPRIVEGNRRRLACLTNVDFEVFDISTTRPEGVFDAVYSVDVIEHVEPEYESRFMENMVAALDEHGVMMVGTPNVTSAPHATFRSSHQHINLKSGATLKDLLARYFHNVFVFSMNDEVIHTGYYPMAHYLFGVGVGKRTTA